MEQFPVFAVWKPAFLGLVEEIDLPKETLDGLKGERQTPTGKRVVAYLHGKLEGMAGFDIPALLSGTVTEEKEQPCVVVLPDGRRQNAVMLLKEDGNGLRGLISLREDMEETFKDLHREDQS